MIYADLAFKNGQIVTVDANNQVVSALAVYDEKIVYAGNEKGLSDYIGAETEVIDLAGKSLLPGFIDAHAHLGSVAINLQWISCSPKAVKSIEEIKAKVREYAEKLPKGSIIRGYNYDQEYLAEGRHPNRWDLDEVAPDHFVILAHTSYHFSVCNSKVLEAMGITGDTPNPPGGEFVREDGIPTGLSLENAHWEVFNTFPVSAEEMKEGLLMAQDYMFKRGITSLHDAGDGETMIRCMIDLNNQKKLKLRTYAMMFSIYGNDKFIRKYVDIGYHTGLGDDRYKVGPYKLMLDGSSMGGTCALRAPYSHDPEWKGILTMDQDTLNEMVLKGHRDNYQITCHCIGDLAVEMILNAYENALTILPKEDHRFRIEHCAITDQELIGRIKALGVIPIPQPEFMYSSGDTYYKLYGDRVHMMFPLKSFLDAGIPCAFSTDCPVVEEDAMLVLRSAVKRESSTGRDVGKEQEISIMDAIRMYTMNGAYAAFEENQKGSLEKGKLADMIILSKPILDTAVDNLCSIEVEKTFIGGKVVYSK